MMGDDDAQRTKQSQVDGELSVPGGGEDFVETLVSFSSERTFMCLQDFFHAVANSPVGAVHVTGNNEEHRNRQVVVSGIGEPQSTGLRVQATFEGQEVRINSPI